MRGAAEASSDGLPDGSLVLALGGFSLDAETESLAAEAVPPPGGTAEGESRRQREVAVGAAALVEHARGIVARALAPGGDLQQEGEALASLCFALRSAVGCAGRLGQEEANRLFDLAAALWDAALESAAAGDSSASDTLDGMAGELYALLEGEGAGGGGPDCARCIAFFSRQAAGWAAAGPRERARGCLQLAMRHSQALEAQVTGPGACERQEEKVISLFSLYLEAAKSAVESKQQALANNLLSRAVSLSRHAAVGPDAALCCAVGIAELQLAQAHAMLAAGGAMSGLAVALLSASYQQLASKELSAAAAGGSPHAAGLLDAKKQVLSLLCRAHLAAGDATAANRALDTLESEAPGASAADADSQALFVRAKLAAGRVAEALRFLVERLRQADLAPTVAAPGGDAQPDPLSAFLAGLRLTLCHLSEDSMPSFQSAVSAFVWKATAAGGACAGSLVGLVQALLAQEREQTLCHRLALQVLNGDDVSAVLNSSSGSMAQVHSVLWHRAAQCFEGGFAAPAKELFAAAFQFARPEAQAKNARALSACYGRLGMHQRAAEWLDIAARHEQQPSSVTQLARLQQLALTGDAAQAVATIRSLASPACPDFHPSLLPAMCQAAASAEQPEVYKEALAVAVQMTMKEGATVLPAGQEAALLLAQVQAIDACIKAARQAVGGGGSEAAAAALLSELAAAVKLAAARLRALGWQAFAGPEASQGGTQIQAMCSLAFNQLLSAQQHGAHEHAVELATALAQLLPLAGGRLQEELAGPAGQAKVLLLAMQALLDVHSKQPDTPKPLALAAKLQTRVSQHLASLPADAHQPHRLLHTFLCLETAARQADGAAMLHSLSKLQPHAAQLTSQQRSRILAALSREPSAVVREGAAALLLDIAAAEGSLEAAQLVLCMLGQLTLPPDQQLAAVERCSQVLASMPAGSRCTGWARCCQALAAHAWNSGCALSQGRQAGAAEGCAGSGGCAAQLMVRAVQLMEQCGPEDAAPLPAMRASLAARGLQEPTAAGEQGSGPTPLTAGAAAVSAAAGSGPAPSAAAAAGGSSEALLDASTAGSASFQPEAVQPTPEPDGPVAAAVVLPTMQTEISTAAAPAPLPAASPASLASGDAAPPAAVLPLPGLLAAGGAFSLRLPGMPAAASPPAAVPALAAAAAALDEGELSDGSEEEGGGPSWLDAIYAAQKRAAGDGQGRQAKRLALPVPRAGGAMAGGGGGSALGFAPAGVAAAGGVKAGGVPALQEMQATQPMAEDNADALSLVD